LDVFGCRGSNDLLGDRYTDQYTRRTVGAFWGNFKDARFLKQMKDNRRIEELILMYVTSSTTILKKDKALEGDGWKLELNKQVAIFIRIMRDALRTVHHVPPELTSRLEMYSTKLTLPKDDVQTSAGPSVKKPPRERDSWVQVPVEGSIEDMPLVQTVGKLFNIEDADLQRDVNAAAKVCTDKVSQASLNVVRVIDWWAIGSNSRSQGELTRHCSATIASCFDLDMSEEHHRWDALSRSARRLSIRCGLPAMAYDREFAALTAHGGHDPTQPGARQIYAFGYLSNGHLKLRSSHFDVL
jgi:hypothetical protein